MAHKYHHLKALFILKRRQDYSHEYSENHLATGMYNSAKFVSDMLEANGIDSKVVIVTDNNDIDREVHKHKPSHVFIEGIWVVPEKFEILKKLHPKVRWVVRCHSEIPFLAQEGNALDWIFKYVQNDVSVSGNSKRINADLQTLICEGLGLTWDRDSMVPLLPNYYPVPTSACFETRSDDKHHFDIACFGAVRPLKNHLIQAVAAVQFAMSHGKGLHFHINSGRVEQNGANQLKNLKALFEGMGPGFKLVENAWMSHPHFLHLMGRMDISMQVSLSETFNIVTADAVAVGTPIVVSDEIAWASKESFAKPTSTPDIVKTLEIVWSDRDYTVQENFHHLKKFSADSSKRWIKFLKA
jgi:hypothetical protein